MRVRAEFISKCLLLASFQPIKQSPCICLMNRFSLVQVLLLLINLVTYSDHNRKIIMEVSAPSDFGNQYNKITAIRALIEYFYKYEEMAR